MNTKSGNEGTYLFGGRRRNRGRWRRRRCGGGGPLLVVRVDSGTRHEKLKKKP
jgi:hypothetical protein